MYILSDSLKIKVRGDVGVPAMAQEFLFETSRCIWSFPNGMVRLWNSYSSYKATWKQMGSVHLL